MGQKELRHPNENEREQQYEAGVLHNTRQGTVVRTFIWTKLWEARQRNYDSKDRSDGQGCNCQQQ
jgi:hypothetical protein